MQFSKLGYLFWIFFCLWIFSYSLNELIENKWRVYYEREFRPIDTDDVYLSICIYLNSVQFSCSGVENGEKQELCNKFKDYILYVEDNRTRKSPKDIIEKFDNFKFPTLYKFSNVNATLLSKYLNFGHLCFAYKLNFESNQTVLDRAGLLLLEISNNYYISTRFFLHGDRIPKFTGKVENLFCVNFKHCYFMKLTFKQFQR